MTQSAPFAGPIAYLTGEYPRATDTFIQREVAALRDLGITVHTCSIRKTDTSHLVGPEQLAEAASTFYVLQAAKSPLTLLRSNIGALASAPRRYFKTLSLARRSAAPGARAMLYQLFYFAEAVVLAQHLKRQGVRHLHNHIATAAGSVAMLTAELSGIPFSFTLHGPDIFFEPHRWRLDEKIHRAQFVACISNFCRSQAMSFCPPEDWPKLHIIHCGVDPQRYDGLPTKNGREVLFVGRLAAVKGLPVLFQALPALVADMPDLRLTLIGDGPDRKMLETVVADLGLVANVTFAGYRSQSAVADKLQTTDLLVLPSFAEGVPVVLMEAMAARVPVLTTQIAGIPELVEHGVSGLLVPPGDVDALGKALKHMLADGGLRARMGAAGREKVIAEFTVATEAARLARLFQAYANPGGAP